MDNLAEYMEKFENLGYRKAVLDIGIQIDRLPDSAIKKDVMEMIVKDFSYGN
jgi:hypothetical protein